MKKESLQLNQIIYGNKGNVWANTCHIYQSGIGNLCRTPALATNWAKIEMVEEIGCPKCLQLFQNQELWNKQPFLERLIFLANKCNLNEDEASILAKLNLEEIDSINRDTINIAITNYLSKFIA